VTSDARRKADLVHQALAAAVPRVDLARSDVETFAALGELLFWIVAADETLLKLPGGEYEQWRTDASRLHLFQGLRFARNGFAHDATGWEASSAERKDVFTERFYDSFGSLVWVPVPPPVTATHLTKYEAYNSRLLGRAVLDTVLDARDQLEEFWASLHP
jgi:hypothetical protein